MWRMVAHRLKRNFKNLKFLKKAKRSARCSFLKSANKDLILCICDCANNVLKGNVRLKPENKKALKRYRKALHDLASRHKGIEAKRKLLVQKGGFLPFLLGPVLSIASGLLGNFLQK